MAESKKTTDEPGSDRDAETEPQLPSAIGKKLKTLYGEVVEEDIPDRFLDLLDKLEKSKKDG